VSKLLVGKQWYSDLTATLQFESEFEAILETHSKMLFPLMHFVPFKAEVRSRFGVKKADFALVDREYRYWWVVEAEMARHDLHGHVIPQVDVLRTGEYSEVHASAMLRANPELDEERLTRLVRGQAPQVWVVVDRNVPNWVQPLKALGVEVGVFEIFLSDRNQYIIRANGSLPKTIDVDSTLCLRTGHRIWQVIQPGLLNNLAGDTFDVEIGNELVPWKVRHFGNNFVAISPAVQGDPLDGYSKVRLVSMDETRWRIEILK
jgi:hypothetical protein